MADIVAKRLVERARYVVMKRPPLGGHSALGVRSKSNQLDWFRRKRT